MEPSPGLTGCAVMLTQLPQDKGKRLAMHNDLFVGHDTHVGSLEGHKHSAMNGYSAKKHRDDQS